MQNKQKPLWAETLIKTACIAFCEKRYIGFYIYKDTEIADGMPRIIDDDLFERVQHILDRNKKAPARARGKEEYLLTTKLFCGYCHEMMTGYGGTGKLGKASLLCLQWHEKRNVRRKSLISSISDYSGMQQAVD